MNPLPSKRGAQTPLARAATPRVDALMALICALFVGSACRCGDHAPTESRIDVGGPRTSSPGFAPLLARGPEVWNIDGKDFRIRATYFLIIDGHLQFTIDYLCDDKCSRPGEDLTEARAFSIAYPLMKYALDHAFHERGQIREISGRLLRPEVIGVAVTQQIGGRERGYRISRTLDEIRAATAQTQLAH